MSATNPFDTSDAPSLEHLNELFPELTFKHLIGVGNMGAVYIANQDKLDREIAVKILPSGKYGGEEFNTNFSEEAKKLAKLNHDGLVRFIDFGKKEGMLFLMMEYAKGELLLNILKRGVFDQIQTAYYGIQICDALAHAHEKGVIHKAIRSRNIVVAPNNLIKVIDFWMESFQAEYSGARDMEDMRYAPPEMLESSVAADHRSDIYSVGVLMMKCLLNMFPSEYAQTGVTYQNVMGNLYPIIYKCIRTSPENRYQDVSILREDLEKFLSDLGYNPDPYAAQ